MNGRPWTTTELRVLRRRYPHDRAEDIATSLGRSGASVIKRARIIGARKSLAFKRRFIPSRRLMESDVRAIRRSGEHRRVLAQRYGVTPVSIDNIRARRTWWHVREGAA